MTVTDVISLVIVHNYPLVVGVELELPILPSFLVLSLQVVSEEADKFVNGRGRCGLAGRRSLDDPGLEARRHGDIWYAWAPSRGFAWATIDNRGLTLSVSIVGWWDGKRDTTLESTRPTRDVPGCCYANSRDFDDTARGSVIS